MASTPTDGHSLPSSPATPPTAFLDDHPRFIRSPSPHAFPDGQAAPSFCAEQDDPALALAAAERKPPRTKRPRASRRPPVTVVTTDASNFRAMVQEFTGFPAPPPFSGLPPHLLSGAGALLPSSGSAAAAFQPMRATPATWAGSTTSTVLDALALFAKTNAIAATAAAAPPRSGCEPYGSYGRVFAGDVPFDDGFEAAQGDSDGAGHGLFSSSLHAGERRF